MIKELLKVDRNLVGPAWIIVPLVESPADRYLFNDIVEIWHGKQYIVKSQSELEEIFKICCDILEFIEQHPKLKKTQLPAYVRNGADRKKYRDFHMKSYKLWKKKRKM